MEDLIIRLSDFYSKIEFRDFQNKYSKEIYDTLGISYSSNHNEVSMVTELCNVVNGKSYDGLDFYSKKIHGSRSYVEFNNKDKPVTTELADMVIISVATRNRDIIFEKLAFVQNKKASANIDWSIDENQLYLLHNFPSFKGNKGIFKNNFKDDIIFLNHSKSLGNYGLFMPTGEMLLLNALSVFRLQNNHKLNYIDVKSYSENNHNNNLWTPFPYFHHPMWKEFLYTHFKYGIPFSNMPFLNNNSFSLNVYDFIRNWTFFNIGEVVSVAGEIVDKNLSQFSRLLLSQLGLSNKINLKIDGGELNNNLVILVLHLQLG